MGRMDFNLTVDPADSIFFIGDLKGTINAELKVTNTTDDVKAVKVKCLDNSIVRIRPPTALVEAGESVTISLSCSCKGGPPKATHHITVLYTDAGDAANARKAFEANPVISRKTIPVKFKEEDEEEKEEKEEEEKDTEKEDEDGRE